MLEMNLRVVGPGPAIRLAVRAARVEGTDTSPDLLQKLCGSLRHRHGVAAVPDPRTPARLIVATQRPLEPLHLVDDEWELEMTDAGLQAEVLTLDSELGHTVLPQLVERAFLATIARSTKLRTYGSPRLWYEPEPFTQAEGIAAYRRYEVSALLIDEVGIVLAVDVGTAFFTTDTLAYFFDPQVPEQERRAREQRLNQLLGRQQGQKGTLQYDTDTTLSDCYFVKAPNGATCGTTGKIRLNGTTYASLADYYRVRHPAFGDTDNLVAVQVSFPRMERGAAWVVAERVRARVMNEQLPRALTQVDKLDPDKRRTLLTSFWQQLGPRPLGRIGQEVASGFWQPPSKNIRHYAPVSLTFGHGTVLPTPRADTREAYREHYRQRLDTLNRAGVYMLPAGTNPLLACAFPASIPQEAVITLVTDMMHQLKRWTGKEFTVEPIPYTSVRQGIEQLQQQNRGVVVFVLNNEPLAYFEVEFYLNGWRIKRITEDTLRQKDRERKEGAWDRKLGGRSGEKGRRDWEQFVAMCTLDLVQQLDGIPWRLDQAGPYEAMLTIDVGPKGRFFAVSLLIAREDASTPSFRLVTRVLGKNDHRETINPNVLQDALVNLVQESLGTAPDPLQSLLVLRDGRTLGQEYEAITAAIERLRTLGQVTGAATVDVVDLHKDSQIPLRLWEVDRDGRVYNPLEGTVVALNEHMLALTTTGRATLQQGTAQPLLLVRTQGNPCLQRAAEAVCAATHLNWDRPAVAHRFPVPVRRTDDELRSREAQEIPLG